MNANEFIYLMQKLARFKDRLQQEGIAGEQLYIVLEIYLQDLTSRINTKILESVV